MRNVASSRVRDVALDVVTVGRWMCPARMALAPPPKENFRDDELDRIIQFRKQEPERVMEYKKWREDNQISSSSAEPAP